MIKIQHGVGDERVENLQNENTTMTLLKKE